MKKIPKHIASSLGKTESETLQANSSRLVVSLKTKTFGLKLP